MRNILKLVVGVLLVLSSALAFGQTTRTVTLSWGSVSGATSYDTYRGTTTGGPYTKIGSVTAPTVTFQDNTANVGTIYFYVVTAVAPACTPTTPVDQPCGSSGFSSEAVTSVPPKPGSVTTVVVSVP